MRTDTASTNRSPRSRVNVIRTTSVSTVSITTPVANASPREPMSVGLCISDSKTSTTEVCMIAHLKRASIECDAVLGNKSPSLRIFSLLLAIDNKYGQYGLSFFWRKLSNREFSLHSTHRVGSAALWHFAATHSQITVSQQPAQFSPSRRSEALRGNALLGRFLPNLAAGGVPQAPPPLFLRVQP